MRQSLILIVEDDAPTRELLAMALRDDGYAVEVAADGTAALALLARVRPDLVLLDLLMAGLDGRAVARAYRETPGPHAPILLTSTTPEPGPTAAEIGAVGYLTKPFDLDDLLEHVRAAIEATPSADKG